MCDRSAPASVRTEEETDEAIVVELRLGDLATAERISRWLRHNPAFAEGVADGNLSVVIADHIPDDVSAPIILVEETAGGTFNWSDERVAARLTQPVDVIKLRIAIEAAAHGMWVREPVKASGMTIELTNREKEVLHLIAEGASNKVIARTLGISTHTAKFHVASLLEKLQVATRTEAVMQGLRLGLLMV